MPQHRSSRQGKSISADIVLLFPAAVGPWPGDKTPGTSKAGSCCSESSVEKKTTRIQTEVERNGRLTRCSAGNPVTSGQ